MGHIPNFQSLLNVTNHNVSPTGPDWEPYLPPGRVYLAGPNIAPRLMIEASWLAWAVASGGQALWIDADDNVRRYLEGLHVDLPRVNFLAYAELGELDDGWPPRPRWDVSDYRLVICNGQQHAKDLVERVAGRTTLVIGLNADQQRPLQALERVPTPTIAYGYYGSLLAPLRGAYDYSPPHPIGYSVRDGYLEWGGAPTVAEWIISRLVEGARPQPELAAAFEAEMGMSEITLIRNKNKLVKDGVMRKPSKHRDGWYWGLSKASQTRH